MRLAVLKERRSAETRVAATPETVKRLIALGLDVVIETGAGATAAIPDSEFLSAGARIMDGPETALSGADIVFAVQAPLPEQRAHIKSGALLVCIAGAFGDPDLVPSLAAAGIDAAAMELLPRITRAQAMDVLSSQANQAGYRAVIEAAGAFSRGFPMMMTAAGTVAPARVLVMGAGVAGLQAIATARRLGAVVSAYDVRPAVKEEVQSLGATFIELALESQQGDGGYAREQSEEFLSKQRELIGEHVAKSDVVITTAAVPGRRAPLLVTGDMVKRMRPGSVIVDLASETGGNVELTQAGKDVDVAGVTIIGTSNVPSTMPLATSQLFARNVANLLLHLVKDGAIKLDFEDEITKGSCVTHGGEIVNERAKQLLEPAK